MPRSSSLLVILCPERSGSTLLSAMLGGHGRVLAPPELHLLRYPDVGTWRRSYPQAAASLEWLLAELGPRGAPRRPFGDGLPVEAAYRELLARCPSGAVLVDQTPAYARDDAALARAERLGPRYVWLLRHPLGVAASLMERYVEGSTAARRWRPSSWRPSARAERREKLARRWRRERLAASLERWRDVHGRVAGFLDGLGDPGRTAVVRYERLVREPERVVGSLCAWLGLEPDPAMLRPWENVPDRLVWGLGDGKLRGTRAIERDRAEAWRRVFDEAADLDPPTRALMGRLGVASAGTMARAA